MTTTSTVAAAPVVRVVDDDESLRRANTRFLRACGFAVRDYASADEFLARDDLTEPGCLLLDLRMPGLDGLGLQERLRSEPGAVPAAAGPLPIVFLSGQGAIPDSVRAMRDGAEDFLTKPALPETLLGAVRRAVERDTAQRAAARDRALVEERYARLTPRERQVFALVITGMLNKQVARELGTTERTVKAQRAQVMEKMAANSLVDLVRAASVLGLGES